MSALYEHLGYQRVPRRRLRGARQGWIARGGDRGGASQPAQALRRVSGARHPRGARERRCRPGRHRSRRGVARSQGEPAQEDPVRDPEAAVVHEDRQGPPRERRQGAGDRSRARQGAGCGAARRARQVPRHRASQVAHLERVLHLAVRGGGLPVDRRVRRLRVDDAGRGARSQARDHRSDRVSPLRRAVLHGGHAVPRVSPVRRGMEDDGARPLRQTQIRRQAARGDPPDGRRTLRARPRLLPAPQRGHRDDLGRRVAPDRQGVLAEARRAAGPRTRRRGSGLLRQVGRHRAQRAGRVRGDLLSRRRRSAQADRARQAVAGGRLRAELGRERQAVRTHGLPGAVRAARGRRRRHRDRRRLLRRARGSGTTAAVRHARRVHRSRLRRRGGHGRHRGRPRATAGTPAST